LRTINIVSDSTSQTYLKSIGKDGRFTIVPLPESESIHMETLGLHRRASNNFVRALRAAPSSARGVIICEDDIVFRNGFLGHLIESLNELQENGWTNFILSAYSPHNHDKDAMPFPARFVRCYDPDRFYGTQCVFLPVPIARALADYIYARGVEAKDAPYDLLLGNYAKAAANLFATRCSLVQHVGTTSTGLGIWHTSPTFDHPWPH
jgi:hypothetical protein